MSVFRHFNCDGIFYSFLTSGNLVDAEYSTKEKIRNIDMPLEIFRILSELASQNITSDSFDSKPEFMLTKTNDPTNKGKTQFKNYCKSFLKPPNLFFLLWKKTKK